MATATAVKVISDQGELVRIYTKKEHGAKFKDLAQQFVDKQRKLHNKVYALA